MTGIGKPVNAITSGPHAAISETDAVTGRPFRFDIGIFNISYSILLK